MAMARSDEAWSLARLSSPTPTSATAMATATPTTTTSNGVTGKSGKPSFNHRRRGVGTRGA